MDGVSVATRQSQWAGRGSAASTVPAGGAVEVLPVEAWHGPFLAVLQKRAVEALEAGKVVVLPRLPFVADSAEKKLLASPIASGARKNVSFDPRSRKLSNVSLHQHEAALLAAMMDRFGEQAFRLLQDLIPAYRDSLTRARTSYRPEEISGRAYSSPRKDDTRLHVDAFPSRPVQGQRILRFFTNIADDGTPRDWTVGEPFPVFARQFMPRVGPPFPGSSWLRERVGLTKGRQSPYDHYMLALHDLAKLNDDYQAHAPRTAVQFAAGTSWLCFTDQVLHAAHAGHGALEQTFHLPVMVMTNPSSAPLRVLERLAGKTLA